MLYTICNKLNNIRRLDLQFSNKLCKMALLQSANMQTRFTILLAPFQSMIKIELEAYLNTTVECYLEIKNPSDQILIVRIYSLITLSKSDCCIVMQTAL